MSTGNYFEDSEAEPATEETTTQEEANYTEASTLPVRGAGRRLPPMKEAEGRPPGPSLRHMPIEDPAVLLRTATSGSTAEQARDTLISVPEGGGAQPSDTHAGIVSVPGDNPDHLLTIPGNADRRGKHPSTIELVIYFEDKTGIHLNVEDGQHAEAGELFEMVMEEMNYPLEAREIFSLWLVSDMLELQLKPNHVPFKLVCYWEELLEKYTLADEEDRERDEPIIIFRRNVFYPRSRERKIQHPEMIRMLFFEAKENIIDGRYPLEKELYDKMAGLYALIKHQGYDPNTHTPEHYKTILEDYYPAHMAKRKWSLFKSKEGPEYRLAQRHEEMARKYGSNLRGNPGLLDAVKGYLEECRKLPFYGAAFFKGQIEHPGRKIRLRTLEDDPVFVAINTDGVFLTDMDDVLFLFGLSFSKLKWDYAEPNDRDNPDCMPCLFLQFESTEENKTVTKVMQVFSREAVLMDAMIDACVKLKNDHRQQGEPGSQEVEAIIRSTGETWSRFNRLCLATFDSKGSCLKNEARVIKSK